jgi:uncharacterized protein (TIGR02300 family)
MKLAKADLGQKRVCPSCQARFYDLQKRPIECPKCQFAFEPESLFKQRRTRQPEPAAVVGAAVAVAEEAEEEQENEEAETEEAEGVEAEPVVVTGDEDDEEEAATEEEEAESAGMSVVEGEAEDVEDIEVDEEGDEDGEPLLEEVEDGDDVAGILDPGVTKDER